MKKPAHESDHPMNELEALRKSQQLNQSIVDDPHELVNQLTEQLQALLTEQERIEQALKESENFYRTIFENTGTMMEVIEEDMSISLVNTEAKKLFGYSKKELEGKKWTEFVAQDDLERLKEYHRLRRVDPAGVPTAYEFN